jgi:hypothetical protein
MNRLFVGPLEIVQAELPRNRGKIIAYFDGSFQYCDRH